jgi:hypothetical protein
VIRRTSKKFRFVTDDFQPFLIFSMEFKEGKKFVKNFEISSEEFLLLISTKIVKTFKMPYST